MESEMFFYEPPDAGKPSAAKLRQMDAGARTYWELVDGMLAGKPSPPIRPEPVPSWLARMRANIAHFAALFAPAEPAAGVVGEPEPIPALAKTKPLNTRHGAAEWLSTLLATGPLPQTVVEEKAIAAGISRRTLKRGKLVARVSSFRLKQKWFWQLGAPVKDA
jgi:hypothetical protein